MIILGLLFLFLKNEITLISESGWILSPHHTGIKLLKLSQRTVKRLGLSFLSELKRLCRDARAPVGGWGVGYPT